MTPLLSPLLPLLTQVWVFRDRKVISSSKPQRAPWRNKGWGSGELASAWKQKTLLSYNVVTALVWGAPAYCGTPGARTGEGQGRPEGVGPDWGRLAWKALSHRPWARVESMCVSSSGRWLLASQSGLPPFQASSAQPPCRLPLGLPLVSGSPLALTERGMQKPPGWVFRN